ncbi:MAG: endopeptidase La, partial [Acidobacteriota bacterium]|nr:endopeptidase La [Acidobacteriota bacterium]
LGIVLVKDPEGSEHPDNLYRVGVAAKILKVFPGDGDSASILINCLDRFRVKEYKKAKFGTLASVEYPAPTVTAINEELRAYGMAVLTTLRDLIKMNPLQSEAIKMFLSRSTFDDPGRLADFAANLTTSSGEELQGVLETFDVRERIDKVLVLLKREVEISRLHGEINRQIHEKISGQQKEFFLKEQLKAIKKELGLEKEGKVTEVERFQERLAGLTLNEEAKKTVDDELEKFQLLEPHSPEYTVSRNYLDWLTVLPWGKFSDDSYDLDRAKKVLDRDHYGLEDVKDRILEFIAVGKLKGNISGSILCLVGPPGVGKTSVGKSIADALGRTFYRFSLGGMRDEAEIKGHRRTYIGALPGKFLQAMKTAGTSNPIIMLDEIDKIGASFQGDPASALLEVLDPEQNSSFRDHYLDVPFDLSHVLFVATGNQLDTIPRPLLDRMEVIRLSGYIAEEKREIARRYLIPKTLKSHGLKSGQVVIKPDALNHLIEDYAREAGVRNLENLIKKIARKVAMEIVKGDKNTGDSQNAKAVNAAANTKGAKAANGSKAKDAKQNGQSENGKAAGKIVIEKKDIEVYLGKPAFSPDEMFESEPGIATGLAWTSMGGATLQIEATSVQCKTKGFKQTGQLGAVMVESSDIAYSYAMAHLGEYGANPAYFEDRFVHIHVPAGATPKDGPSAGVTMATALLSMVLGKPVRKHLAMTGELTLTGQVLPIGGVKEKVIAARRVRTKTLIFPEANRKDFDELPEYLKKGFAVHFAARYEDVFKIALGGK